jgi:hypothetical protein
MVRTVASTIVEVLARAGVERVYGVAGDSLNGFTDAVMTALISSLERKTDRRHLQKSLEHSRAARESLDELATERSEAGPLHP